MTNLDVFSRGIKSVRTPHFQRNSDIHTMAWIVEPGHWEEHDPFLLMAHDHMRSGVFGIHPHRGMETVTFLIDGNLNHYDSKHGTGVLHAGDAQWMTAGRGVEHLEDAAKGETVNLLQLWVNIPSGQKMSPSRYQDLRKTDMPVIHENGTEIRWLKLIWRLAQSTSMNFQRPITDFCIFWKAKAPLGPIAQ